MKKPVLSNKKIYRILLWSLLIAGIVVLLRLAPILAKPEYIPVDDFFQFWAGGSQNLQAKNPFDPVAIEQLRIQQGSNPGSDKVPIMLNPPWMMALSMPFGLISYPVSRLTWLLLCIIIVLVSALTLWRLYSSNPKQRWLAILAVFIYAPTISVLEKGQLTSLVLLGLTGFLYFTVYKRNDWMAGVCLYLVSSKPQVVVLFWLAVLIWVIQQHRWLVLVSTALTVIMLTLISIAFNPPIIQQYMVMLQTYGISDWANPTIGAYLRFFWFGLDKFWLQFLPSALASIWFIVYWVRRQGAWDWKMEMPVILLVSLVTAPYAWTYDQVVLIPVIIQSAIWLAADWKRWSARIFVIVFLALSMLDLYLHTRFDEFWFIWLAPAMLVWYLLIRWQFRGSPTNPRLSYQTNG
jgi:hypothetical protein